MIAECLAHRPELRVLLRVLLLVLSLPVSVSTTGCPSSSTAELAPRAQLLNDLSVFVQGVPLSAEQAKERVAELGQGDLTLERYIDDLLAKPMSGRIARDVVISPSENRKDRHPIPLHSLLKSFEPDGGERIYFLREKCEPESAVRVQPWWSTDKEVLVCPEAYRPEVKGDREGRTCGASMLSPRESDVCGCGAHLMYCTRSDDQFRDLQDNIQREVWETTAHVVNNDVPLEELFLMNASVRNDEAEMMYRRARIAAGEPDSLLPVTDFPTKAGALRPRQEQAPGHHAGVLTMPALVYSSDALRGVMRNYFDYLWCAGVASSRVSTQGILALDIVDLRVGDGWQKLAAMNVCTDCHARLDYGMQFFNGFPSSTAGLDFRPLDVRKGSGPLYGNDIKDERGTGELTPHGFAKLAVAQPEFGKCMTKKVIDHVFNGTESSADFKAVHETFTTTHRFKPMLRTALLRYAERNKDGLRKLVAAPPMKEAAPSATAHAIDAAAAVPAGAEAVTLSKELRALLDDACMNCHDKGDAYDFNGATLPRNTLVAMMDQVGFGAMPKTVQGLDDDERRALLRALAPLAFENGDARALAFDYFANGLRAKPVHRYRAAMATVNARAGGSGEGFRPSAIEADIEQSLSVYTPGIAVTTGVAALRDCKNAKLTGKELEACVERSSAPTNVIVGAVIGD